MLRANIDLVMHMSLTFAKPLHALLRHADARLDTQHEEVVLKLPAQNLRGIRGKLSWLLEVTHYWAAHITYMSMLSHS